MVRSLALGTLLVVLWLALSGRHDVLLLTLGLLSVMMTVWIARRMDIDDAEGLPGALFPRVLGYLPWLGKAIVASNMDVARRVVSPRLPIEPKILTVTADQRTALGRVVYANSITLTPGTISLEVRADEIEVHALSATAASELRTNNMGHRVRALEAK